MKKKKRKNTNKIIKIKIKNKRRKRIKKKMRKKRRKININKIKKIIKSKMRKRIRKITQKNFLKIRFKTMCQNQCRNSPHSIGNFPITPYSKSIKIKMNSMFILIFSLRKKKRNLILFYIISCNIIEYSYKSAFYNRFRHFYCCN